MRTATGQVRVVNHLQQVSFASLKICNRSICTFNGLFTFVCLQSQVNHGNRVAYLLPATSTTATAGPGGTPGRQLLIATPTIQGQNRQVVSSMPPLIFKGGNFVPAGSPTTLISQNNRSLVPKQLRVN